MHLQIPITKYQDARFSIRSIFVEGSLCICERRNAEIQRDEDKADE